MSGLPLSGVRVLDLSNHFAGPMAAMHLADYGAEVIKVEHPAHGDELRRWGSSKDGVGLFFKVVNRNKKAITLDLKHSTGQQLARDLASSCDVVIENFRTGRLEEWNLDYQALSERNPSLVMLHLTGFGRTGPRATNPGFGSLVEAFAGAVFPNGYADRRPLMQPFGFGDATAAIFAAHIVMVALFHRERTGDGQEIDLGLYEPILTMLGPQIIDYDQLGVVQERSGPQSPHVSPRGTFQTRDGGWVAVSGSTQATFERIARALELDELTSDPRFATNALRVKNATELIELLDGAIGGIDRNELLARAAELEVTIAPVNNVADLYADPQLLARENIATVADDELGTVRMQNVAGRLSRTPGRITHAGPRLGEHNAELYSQLLDLSAQDLEELAAEGVI